MLLENSRRQENNIREGYFISLICLFYLFHGFTTSPLFVGYGYDREVFRYFGMLIYNGGVPYVDAFDHKPPVIYLLFFLGHVLNNGPWGAFIVFQIIGASASLMLFAACKKHISKNSSLIVTFFYIALVKYDFILNEGGLTRELSSALTMMLFSICLFSLRNKTIFLSGVLFTVIFYTQQNEVIAIIPLLIYFLSADLDFRAEDFFKTFVMRSLIFIAGCLLIHFAIFFLFYRWDALEEFISQAFFFNTQHYIGENSFLVRFAKVIYNMTFGLEIYSPIFLAMILCCYPLIELLRYRNVHKVYYFLFASLFLQFVAMALGRLQPHYFLSLIPYLVLIIFYFLKYYPDVLNGLMNRERIAVGSVAIIIMLAVVKGYDYGHPRKRSHAYKHEEQFYKEIYKVRGMKGQLYTFDTPALAFNSDLNIVAPSKWIYHHFFMAPGFDDDNKLFKSVLQDIEKSECTYVIVPLIGRLPEQNRKELKVYLDEKYNLHSISANDNLRLYKRKN